MLSEETFPEELQFDEESENFESIKSRSLENLNSYFSAENSDYSQNSTDINKSMVDSINIEHLIKSTDLAKMTKLEKHPTQQQQQQQTEASFQSINESARIIKVPAPSAPIKKRKSYSCHDLQLRKNSSNNYDHVESKVKKMIENMNDDRRKPFNRTKSMPVCPVQAPSIDNLSFTDNNNAPSEHDLRREIRRKSIKIYELEEKCETKDAKILELQYEKAKMKMTFDNLRQEIEKLKDIEVKYKQMKAFTPDKTHLKSVLIQTENHQQPPPDAQRQLLLVDSSERRIYKETKYDYTPVARHLTFSEGTSYFSTFNNTSSDNLIPFESNIVVEDLEEDDVATNTDRNLNETVASMTAASTATDDTTTTTGKKKKTKKFRFFKLMQCISGKP